MLREAFNIELARRACKSLQQEALSVLPLYLSILFEEYSEILPSHRTSDQWPEKLHFCKKARFLGYQLVLRDHIFENN